MRPSHQIDRIGNDGRAGRQSNLRWECCAVNAVGVDVSKGRSMVAVRRPFNEIVVKPFEVRYTGSELSKLADYLKSLDGETRVVMEHTGRYYEQIAQYLHDIMF